MKSSFHSVIPFLSLFCSCQFRRLYSIQAHILAGWCPETRLFAFDCSMGHIAIDGQSVSLGVEPHLGLMTRYLLLFDSYGLVFVGRDSYGLVLWCALSDVRAGLSFVYAAGHCQRSLPRVRVPWDSRPYFTV
jgi:hypothetical protein